MSQANAASTKQIRHAERKERDGRERELADLRAVLATVEGRRFLWRVMGDECKVFGSIWHPSALIHHNSGKQDVGHFILAEIAAADEDKILVMMKESRDAKRRDALEAESVRTASATDQTE